MKGKFIHKSILACLLMSPLAALVLLPACMKDKGNYQYSNINQVKFGLTTADTLSVSVDDTLKIPVNITQTNGQDSLSYHWYIVQASSVTANPVQYLLDSNKDLHARITVHLGNYNVIDKVTDQKTGVSFYKYFSVQVVPSVAAGEGWLVLQNEMASGNGDDISIILSRDGLTHGTVYSDLYYKANGYKLPLGTNYFNVINYASSMSTQKIVFGYPGGGTQVRATDYTDSSYSNTWFLSLPAGPINIQNNSVPSNGSYELLVSNNQVWYENVNPTTIKSPPIVYGAPVQGSWTISPYILQYDGGSAGYMMMYDTVHSCFLMVNVSSNNAMVPVLPDVPNAHYANFGGAASSLLPTGTGFDYNNIGKSLIYAENAQPVTVYNSAVTFDCFFRSKTQDSTYVIQVPVYLSMPNNNAAGRYYLDPAKCPGINSATQFACPTYLNMPGEFFYVNQNNIYKCAISTTQGASSASIAYGFAPGTIIKAMRTLRSEYATANASPYTPLPATEGKVLVVATDETASGNGNNVYFFQLDANGNIVTTNIDTYTGFKSIVDIRFKKQIGL